MRLFRLGIASVLLLLVAACGSTPTGSDETGSSPAPATATAASQTENSPQPSLTETAMAGGAGAPLAVFMRSGGIAGITETLVVQSDGTLQAIQGQIGEPVINEGRATPEQLEKLKAALQSEGWQQLDVTYGQQVADGFAYTIVAGSKAVRTYDGVQNPPALENMLSLLDELEQQLQ